MYQHDIKPAKFDLYLFNFNKLRIYSGLHFISCLHPSEHTNPYFSQSTSSLENIINKFFFRKFQCELVWLFRKYKKSYSVRDTFLIKLVFVKIS